MVDFSNLQMDFAISTFGIIEKMTSGWVWGLSNSNSLKNNPNALNKEPNEIKGWNIYACSILIWYHEMKSSYCEKLNIVLAKNPPNSGYPSTGLVALWLITMKIWQRWSQAGAGGKFMPSYKYIFGRRSQDTWSWNFTGFRCGLNLHRRCKASLIVFEYKW